MDLRTFDLQALQSDADLASPLSRVSYAAGMLLGLEAVRAEQDYHRRRANRHQRWLHGIGTVAGLLVRARERVSAEPAEPTTFELEVGRGLALDAFGREVVVEETHCLNLDHWLERAVAELPVGLQGDALHLSVYARHEACPKAEQPVLSHAANHSTDAVSPSRVADGFELELVPEVPDAADLATRGLADWQRALPSPDLDDLTDEEQDFLGTRSAEDLVEHGREARLLFAFDGPAGAPAPFVDPPEGDAQERLTLLRRQARVLLAHVRLQPFDPAAPVLALDRIHVNNLVRPFALPANHERLDPALLP